MGAVSSMLVGVCASASEQGSSGARKHLIGSYIGIVGVGFGGVSVVEVEFAVAVGVAVWSPSCVAVAVVSPDEVDAASSVLLWREPGSSPGQGSADAGDAAGVEAAGNGDADAHGDPEKDPEKASKRPIDKTHLGFGINLLIVVAAEVVLGEVADIEVCSLK